MLLRWNGTEFVKNYILSMKMEDGRWKMEDGRVEDRQLEDHGRWRLGN